MFSAGQIRDRARLLLREVELAKTVAQARPDLGREAMLFTGPDFPTVDQLFVAPPAMTDGFTVPGQPLPLLNLPRAPLFQDRLPMLAPEAQPNEVLDETPADQLMSLPPADAENRTEPLSLPSEDGRAPMLESETAEKIYAGSPGFDIPNLTPEAVQQMSPAEQLDLSVALMQYRQQAAEHAVAELRELIAQAGERDVWPRVAEISKGLAAVILHSHELWEVFGENRKAAKAFNSSSTQLPLSVRMGIDNALEGKACGEDGLALLQEAVDYAEVQQTALLADGLNFVTSGANVELKNQIPRWLRTRSPREESVEGQTLVLRYPEQTEVIGSLPIGDILSKENIWPPDPAHPIVSTMFRALGWEMSVISLPEGGFEVRLWQKP